MRMRQDERGQMLVLTALSMMILLGFMALAMDVGLLYRAKRNMQIAADAAATAGALDYYMTQSLTSAKVMAQTAATNNGVTNGVSGATVAVNIPPLYGSYQGSAGFVEAIVIQPNPTVFLGLFGLSPTNVATRAVAGQVVGSACTYLMNQSGTDLSLQGAATITAPGGQQTCGVYSNSSSANSVTVNGQGNTINTAYVGTVGGLSAGGKSNTTPTPTTTGVPSQSPPSSMLNLAPDATAISKMSCAAPSGTTVKISGNPGNGAGTYIEPTGTLSPGCYTGNVMLGTTTTSGSSLTLSSGLYVFPTGQVYIGNNVTGNSVTLDINSGPLFVSSTSNAYLSAPTDTTNPYNGVLFLAPNPTSTNGMINTSTWTVQWGSSSVNCTTTPPPINFDGLIDAPGVTLSLQDQGGCVMTTGLIVGSLTLQTGTLILDNYNTAHATSPLRSIALVE